MTHRPPDARPPQADRADRADASRARAPLAWAWAWAWAWAVIALAALGGGCDAQRVEPARLRVIHALPDAPEIDIAINGEAVARHVEYPYAITGFTTAPGPQRVQAFRVGQDSPVADVRLVLDQGQRATVTLGGPIRDDRGMRARVWPERSLPPREGFFWARVYRLSREPERVDVVFRGPVVDAAPALRQESVSADLQLPAGQYRVEVFRAGTRQAVAILESAAFVSGGRYAVVIAGEPEGSPGRSLGPGRNAPTDPDVRVYRD
ncbi:MAG: hypothetical protein C0475_06655 [Planctomyces sp.]|nr:hypothetical protein [Planctomyces sp.]